MWFETKLYHAECSIQYGYVLKQLFKTFHYVCVLNITIKIDSRKNLTVYQILILIKYKTGNADEPTKLLCCVNT